MKTRVLGTGGPRPGLHGHVGVLRPRRRERAQLALAWLLAQGDDVVPIPGTKRLAYLEENAAAADVTLTAEQLDALARAVPADAVRGARYPSMSEVER